MTCVNKLHPLYRVRPLRLPIMRTSEILTFVRHFLSLQTTELVRPFCSQAFFRRGRFLGLSVLRYRKQDIAIHLQLSICAIYVRRLTWCISGYWSPCRNLFTPIRCRRIREAPTFGGGGGNRTPVQNDVFLRVREDLAHTNTVYVSCSQAEFRAAKPLPLNYQRAYTAISRPSVASPRTANATSR